MQKRSEAHGVNLDGRCTGGVDLDGGRVVEVHTEEGRGTSVEAADVASRRTRRRSGRQWVCDREMIWLGFRSSVTLKKENSSNEQG
jgi:sugar lactone lactonase YvrE